MSTIINAGRIAPIPKGLYNASTQYAKLDIVTYSNESYICKQACKGIAPTDGDYWQQLAGAAGGGKSIVSVTLTSSVGLVDTYTITYTDATTSTFTVTNGKDGTDGTDGRGIISIAKTASHGLIDTYTITYTDRTTSTYQVKNGANGAAGRGISSITKTGTSGLVDTYTITYSDATTSTFNVTNGAQGEPGATISSVEKTATAGKVDTYTITMTDGSTFTFQVTNGMDGVDLGLATIVDDLTTGGTTNVLSAEQGKRLKQITDGIVASGLDEYTTNSEVKVVDDISTATSKWSGPNNVHINGAPVDAFFSKDGIVTSVTFQTKKISGIDPGKTVTFKAWNKDAGTVRVLGSLESTALDTIETFAVSWQMYAGEYLMVYGNISCTGATGDVYNTYKVDYNEATGVVTSVSFVYKQKIGLHYTYNTTYEDVPSLLSLDSPTLFEKSRVFTIRQFGVLSPTPGKDTNLQFDKASKVDRDCILWSVKVNKSTTGTSNVYAFNLSTMKRRVLATFTPSVAGIYEIPVNQPVYKDEYVAVSCAAISVSSGYGYAYTVDANNNLLTISNGGRTENVGSVYTFLLDYAPSFATNHYMYGAGLSQGANIAIFGGSFSINGSRYVKTIYDNILQPKAITHYGVGGCGFINGTTPIPTQIDNAIASGVMYDTWILWASTNDCGQPVGQPTDAAGTTSQAAAMRLCINKIYAYNPYAKIVVFGSARAFSQAKFNEQNGQLHQLAQGQKAFCEYWDIPYLDQWEGIGINTINFAVFFDADQLHWNDRGYELACHRQAQFLKNLV